MTRSNLALIFAPCLMSLCNTAEELGGPIHLKTEVVLSLIENAYTFGMGLTPPYMLLLLHLRGWDGSGVSIWHLIEDHEVVGSNVFLYVALDKSVW